MAARVVTVAFQGVEAVRVGVEVLLTPGTFVFTVVGLGDKAVAENRKRVIAAFVARRPASGRSAPRIIGQHGGVGRRWAEGQAVRRVHAAEALIYRRVAPGSATTAAFAS